MTTKQTRFVEEYCVDFNATQAAVRAGYSEKTARFIGSENLTKPNIKEAVTERLNDLSMSADEALQRLTDQGRNLQMRYLKADGSVDLQGLIDAGLSHLVKSTKFNAQGRLMIEFYDAQSAIKEIAKVRGLVGPKGTKDDPLHHAIQGVVFTPPGASKTALSNTSAEKTPGASQ